MQTMQTMQTSPSLADSSRLCVKNLPGYVTEERLRGIFSSCPGLERSDGIVTDVRIMRARSGKSRRFGFVGFKTSHAAKVALKFLNNTYVDTMRIVVEPALPPGSDGLARPWSRYSVGSSLHREQNPLHYEREKVRERRRAELDRASKSVANTAAATEKESREFEEFLSVVQGRKNNKFWANDDMSARVLADTAKHDPEQSSGDEAEYFDNPGLDGDNGGDNVNDDNDGSTEEAKKKDKKNKKNKKDKKDKKKMKHAGSEVSGDEEISDMAFLRMKSATFPEGMDVSAQMRDDEDSASSSDESQSEHTSCSDEDEHDGGDDDDSGGSGKSRLDDSNSSEAHSVPPEIAIADTGRLYVRNLPYSANEEELEEMFGRYGKVVDVHIPRDDAKRSKGFAFVLFMFPEHAVRASADLDGTIFQGRLLHIIPAREAPKARAQALLEDAGDDVVGSMTFKKRRELKRQADAQKDDGWNTLFIRSNTVADAIAERYAVKKRDILDKDAGNMAVRMALAETQLIGETKKFLEEHGVALSSIEGKSKSSTKRSKTAILVKNIPFSTEEGELRRMFSRHGTVGRVLLPPSKTMAVVEFLESGEAKRAFRRLAYTKSFFQQPLVEAKAQQAKENAALAEQAESQGAKTLFLKNLNFDTEERTLVDTFKRAGPVAEAKVARKKNMRFGKGGRDSDKRMLSMGFGFVEFKSSESASKALRTLQGIEVDGYRLVLKISNRASASAPSGSGTGATVTVASAKRKRAHASDAGGTGDSGEVAQSTKIIVKNVAFQASPRELRELFGTFGQIKALRLPRKFDGQHRGFAFVEFATKQESLHAFQMLGHTHLYGRKLVIEWAKADESLEDIREKAMSQLQKEQHIAGERATFASTTVGARSKRIKLGRSKSSSKRAPSVVDDSSKSFASLLQHQ